MLIVLKYEQLALGSDFYILMCLLSQKEVLGSSSLFPRAIRDFYKLQKKL